MHYLEQFVHMMQQKHQYGRHLMQVGRPEIAALQQAGCNCCDYGVDNQSVHACSCHFAALLRRNCQQL